jgi:aromatase
MSGHTDNTIVINAPLDLVWDMTNDVESWTELYSEYSGAEILGRDETSVRFRLTMHADDQGRIWSWVSEREPDITTRTVRARRLETGAFKYMSLFWEFTETPEGVAMRWLQDFEMKVGAHADDAGMEEHLNKHSKIQQARIKGIVEAAAVARGVAA